MFALSGVVGRVIGICAPVIVAYLATATSLKWRFPYLITGRLLILAGIWALFALKEPVRGYMERRALGMSRGGRRQPGGAGQLRRGVADDLVDPDAPPAVHREHPGRYR